MILNLNIPQSPILIKNRLKMQIKIKSPILQSHILTIRDPSTSRPQFRGSLEKIGEIVALQIAEEIQEEVGKVGKTIQTCLGVQAKHQVMNEPVLVTILRAGICFHYGMMRVFENSQSGFIGAMRNQQTLKPELSYQAIPDITNKIVILADTMLATGGTFVQAIDQLQKHKPRKIIVAAVISAPQGIAAISNYDNKIPIYFACLDEKLNEKGYIMPGLGDAGDRCFGQKI